jgi:hypothetical protein
MAAEGKKALVARASAIHSGSRENQRMRMVKGRRFLVNAFRGVKRYWKISQ